MLLGQDCRGKQRKKSSSHKEQGTVDDESAKAREGRRSGQ